MTVSLNTSIAPAAATSTSTNSGALKGFAENFDSFLTLLTTQLKNQDPLSPMDSTQFTSQLVQFTGVEQAIHQNQSLATLIDLQKDQAATSAVDYLGKTVVTDGSKIQLSGGSASLNYALAGPSAETKISILDKDGKLVKTLNGATAAGPSSVVWDGKGDDGIHRTDGSYTIQISAKDSNSNAVAASAESTGIVTNVSLTDGKVLLTVGGRKVPLADVLSVRATT